jgi:hypothetical protein
MLAWRREPVRPPLPCFVSQESRWGWCIVDEGGKEPLHYLMSGDRGRDGSSAVKQPGMSMIDVVGTIGTREPL